ncbi:MAG: pantetheine-phosphate adenylyltransferase [Alphaproteobacteria bacterium]|nr:pantetheine-phosphate adenylyltransferase [Alphaproteobacteria bacterium]
MQERVGLYPGTFDPITNGHLDVINRAAKLTDRLVVGVAINPGKEPMFLLEERLGMVRDEVATLGRRDSAEIEVRSFDSLLMHYAIELGAQMIIRGLRAVSDFDYEFQMVCMNARLNRDIETVFLMASEGHHFIAARLVKEIAVLGGDISSFVSQAVAARLLERLERAEKTGTGGT